MITRVRTSQQQQQTIILFGSSSSSSSSKTMPKPPFAAVVCHTVRVPQVFLGIRAMVVGRRPFTKTTTMMPLSHNDEVMSHFSSSSSSSSRNNNHNNISRVRIASIITHNGQDTFLVVVCPQEARRPPSVSTWVDTHISNPQIDIVGWQWTQ